MKRCLGLFFAAAAVLFATACSEPFVTNTGRSAVEEMLICTVVERGISKAEFGRYQGKIVKLAKKNSWNWFIKQLNWNQSMSKTLFPVI